MVYCGTETVFSVVSVVSHLPINASAVIINSTAAPIISGLLTLLQLGSRQLQSVHIAIVCRSKSVIFETKFDKITFCRNSIIENIFSRI